MNKYEYHTCICGHRYIIIGKMSICPICNHIQNHDIFPPLEKKQNG